MEIHGEVSLLSRLTIYVCITKYLNSYLEIL